MARSDFVLLVDDDPNILESSAKLLEQEMRMPCRTLALGNEVLPLIQTEKPAIVILDLGLPDVEGELVLRQVCQEYPEIPVVIVTALAHLETAVRCMSAGAYDYVVKGADTKRLIASVRRALDYRNRGLEIESLRERMQSSELLHPEVFAEIVTASDKMLALFRFIEAVALLNEPILLVGETGTGKELFAKAIHKARLSDSPYVVANVGGMDDVLVSDTLFGHAKGAYTGASETRKGLVASAEGGTLFLDEIGELSPTSQVKLLRFLEYREYHALGSDLIRRSNTRVIVATNRDLGVLASEGKFRKDLLFRLSTYRINIPPLRQRSEDVPLLVRHFAKEANLTVDNLFTREALSLLIRYPFPGNVRELRSILLRAQVDSKLGPVNRATMAGILNLEVSGEEETPEENLASGIYGPQDALPTIRQAIQDLIREAMRRTGGKQNEAAALLGITPQALSSRLKRNGNE